MMAVCGNTLWMLGGVVEVNVCSRTTSHHAGAKWHPPTIMCGMPLIGEPYCAASVRESVPYVTFAGDWTPSRLTLCLPQANPCFSPAQVAHTDVTLDDLWALDLQKLAGWRCVQENTAGEEAFQDEEGWETDSAGAEGEAAGGDRDHDEEGEDDDDDDDDEGEGDEE